MHNTQVQDFARGDRARARELVVVDPRFSMAAGKARYWLPIKPGTDIALLLAWMHVILDEGLYDARLRREARDRASRSCKAHVADKTPEWAFPHTAIAPRAHPRDGALHRRGAARPRSSTPAATPPGTATTPSARGRSPS